MRRARLNTLERRKTPRSFLKVIMLFLLLVIVTLNAFVLWVLVLLHIIQTKRVMIMKANNEVETDGDDEKEKMPQLKDVNGVCVKYPVEGETLMVRRAMNMHVKVDDSEGQRRNIFHMRCHVHNKLA
jgi:hypothetical protein